MVDYAKIIWDVLSPPASNAPPLKLALRALGLYVERLSPRARLVFAESFGRDFRRRWRAAARAIANSPFLTEKFGAQTALFSSFSSHPAVRASAGLREVFASPPKRARTDDEESGPGDTGEEEPQQKRQRTDDGDSFRSSIVLSTWHSVLSTPLAGIRWPVPKFIEAFYADTPSAAVPDPIAANATIYQSVADAASIPEPQSGAMNRADALTKIHAFFKRNGSTLDQAARIGYKMGKEQIGEGMVWFEPNPNAQAGSIDSTGFSFNLTKLNIETAPTPVDKAATLALELPSVLTTSANETQNRVLDYTERVLEASGDDALKNAGVQCGAALATGGVFGFVDEYAKLNEKIDPNGAARAKTASLYAKRALGAVGAAAAAMTVGSAVVAGGSAAGLVAAGNMLIMSTVMSPVGAFGKTVGTYGARQMWWKHIVLDLYGIHRRTKKRVILTDVHDVWDEEAGDVLPDKIREMADQHYKDFDITRDTIWYLTAPKWERVDALPNGPVSSFRKGGIGIVVYDDLGYRRALKTETFLKKRAEVVFEGKTTEREIGIEYETIPELYAEIGKRIKDYYILKAGLGDSWNAKVNDKNLGDFQDKGELPGQVKVYAKQSSPSGKGEGLLIDFFSEPQLPRVDVLMLRDVAEYFKEADINRVTTDMVDAYLADQARIATNASRESALEAAIDARREVQERDKNTEAIRLAKARADAAEEELNELRAQRAREQVERDRIARFGSFRPAPAAPEGAGRGRGLVRGAGPGSARGGDSGRRAAAALSAVGSGPDEIEAAARLLLSSGMFF